MSQHDGTLDNQTFPSFRSDLNAALQAILGLSSGATAPATTFAYQLWADTTTGLLKIRNAANSAWITVGTLASANLGLIAETLLTTRGDIITRGASASQRLAVGTAQQILRSDGVDPAWAALITALTEDTSPDWAADFILSRDVSASLDKKVLIKNLFANKPAFRVTRGGTAQTGFVSAAITKIQLTTVDFDIGTFFDNATNYRWTPPAGKYALFGATQFKVLTDQGFFSLSLRKNGSTIAQVGQRASGTSPQSLHISDVVSANGTDYFELWAQQSTGVNQDIDGSGALTWFSGHAI